MPHLKIVNQPVRAPTTQSSIVSSDGVSEIEKFAVNLVRVMSEHSTHLRKNHQCLRGQTPCLHSNINELLSEPSAIMAHTAEAFNERESEEVLFEHSHNPIKNNCSEIAENSRMAQACLAWHCDCNILLSASAGKPQYLKQQ